MNFYQKIFYVVEQWADISCAAFRPTRLPVRIRVQDKQIGYGNSPRDGVQDGLHRRLSVLKYKR